MQTNKDLEGDAPEKRDTSPSRTTPDGKMVSCRTVLVSECKENVAVIEVVKEATNEKTEFITRKDVRKAISNTKLTEQVLESQEIAMKSEKEEKEGSFGVPGKKDKESGNYGGPGKKKRKKEEEEDEADSDRGPGKREEVPAENGSHLLI